MDHQVFVDRLARARVWGKEGREEEDEYETKSQLRDGQTPNLLHSGEVGLFPEGNGGIPLKKL